METPDASMEHPETRPNTSRDATDETSRAAPPTDDNAPSSPVHTDDERRCVAHYAAVSRYRQLDSCQNLADKNQIAHAFDMGGQEAEDECRQECMDLLTYKHLPLETHVRTLQLLSTLLHPAGAVECLLKANEVVEKMEHRRREYRLLKDNTDRMLADLDAWRRENSLHGNLDGFAWVGAHKSYGNQATAIDRSFIDSNDPVMTTFNPLTLRPPQLSSADTDDSVAKMPGGGPGDDMGSDQQLAARATQLEQEAEELSRRQQNMGRTHHRQMASLDEQISSLVEQRRAITAAYESDKAFLAAEMQKLREPEDPQKHSLDFMMDKS